MKALFRTGPITALVMILLGAGTHASAASPASGLERFYIGTYSGAICQSSLNLGAGSFGAASQAVATGDPSFVAMTPDRKFSYAVNEGAGTVVPFSVNRTNGVLTFLNQMPANGGAPHLRGR